MIKKYCNHCQHVLINYDEKYCNACTTKVNKANANKIDSDYMKLIKSKKWNKISKLVREEQPMCERCLYLAKHNLLKGVVNPSQEVHHRLKVRDRPDLALNRDNLMALCKSCHKYLTDKGF